MKPRVGDIVSVLWSDAWQDASELRLHQFPSETEVETLGWLVRLEPTVSIAPEKTEEGWRGTTHIPPGIVKRIRVLHRP